MVIHQADAVDLFACSCHTDDILHVVTVSRSHRHKWERYCESVVKLHRVILGQANTVSIAKRAEQYNQLKWRTVEGKNTQNLNFNPRTDQAQLGPQYKDVCGLSISNCGYRLPCLTQFWKCGILIFNCYTRAKL